VQQEFLDCEPENFKYVVLNCEYTGIMKNVKQRSLPLEKK
jgi:hypothetical protein